MPPSLRSDGARSGAGRCRQAGRPRSPVRADFAGRPAPLAQVTEDHLGLVLGVNVKGTVFTVQKALPVLNDDASVILSGSIWTAEGPEGFGVHSATKAATQSFARTWANELKVRGIRVNAISPGTIDTPGLDAAIGGAETESGRQVKEFLVSRIPLGRIGTPDDVADAVLFLASDQSRFITGTELFVDGGTVQVQRPPFLLCHRTVEIPVRRGPRKPEPGAEPLYIAPVPKPGQGETCLMEWGEQSSSTARATSAPLGRKQSCDVEYQFTGDIECTNIGHDAEPPWIEAFCGKSPSVRRSACYVASIRFHPLWAICQVRVAEISSLLGVRDPDVTHAVEADEGVAPSLRRGYRLSRIPLVHKVILPWGPQGKGKAAVIMREMRLRAAGS